jgi:predicted dehydrogenase
MRRRWIDTDRQLRMNQEDRKMSQSKLRVLQIGAGSMGTRRMRDLSDRSGVDLALFDSRPDRLEEAVDRFGVTAFELLDQALGWKPDALIISTPPDQHDPYVELALDEGLHHFCEENIWTYDYRKVQEVSQRKGLTSLPSCSFHFLPAVKELKRIVTEELGGLHVYQMALSSYMPGWHPQEGAEFYARHRHTAAAREMVPFELVWLNHVFGAPARAIGSLSRNGRLEVESEDTWCIHMDLSAGGHGQLLVVQASPTDCRTGRAFGTHGWIEFDLFQGTVKRHLNAIGIEDTRDVGGQIKCMEQAYKDEINTFVDVIQGRAAWPHSYLASSLATGTLAAAEHGAVTGQKQAVDPDRQPQQVPSGGRPVVPVGTGR